MGTKKEDGGPKTCVDDECKGELPTQCLSPLLNLDKYYETPSQPSPCFNLDNHLCSKTVTKV